MDKLDSLIASTRQDVELSRRNISEAQAALQILEARLSALEEAASARPIAGSTVHRIESTPNDGVRRSGRQPGAISMDWKRVLVLWDENDPHGLGLDYTDIFPIVELVGIEAEPASVRDRIRRYADDLGLLERVGNRFKLKAGVADRYRQDVANASTQPNGGALVQISKEEALNDDAM
jgi:hypothetical protein